ncbi:hypothetical protein Btru_005787 [Bulinus truncatus]|nr:hypothetical protein Btru_005787 [Bulinus truncatus]
MTFVACMTSHLMYSHILMLLHVAETLSLQTSSYTRSLSCYTQERIQLGCMSSADTRPVSRAFCAVTCSVQNNCEGYSLDPATHRCYLHVHCPGLGFTCPSQDDGLQHFDRLVTDGSCVNEGIYDSTSRRCRCIHSFAGYRCERRAGSCEEVFEYTDPIEMLESTIVSLPTLSQFRTYCSKRPGEITTHLSLYAGNGRFNKNWSDYVKGFTENSTGRTEFWIGLENIRYLTSRAVPQDLIISVTLSPTSGSSSNFIATYSKFTVGDAATFYRYNFSTFYSNKTGPLSANFVLNNCLGAPAGIGFSTFDADHDNDPHPAVSHTGWWFMSPPGGAPPPCNPFGVMFTTLGEPPSPDHMKLDAIGLPGLYNYKVQIDLCLRSRPPPMKIIKEC